MIMRSLKNYFKRKHGSGIAVILFGVTATILTIIIMGRLTYNYYLSVVRENLAFALRDATTSALTQIDYTSAKGLFGLSNGGSPTIVDEVFGYRKSLKLDESKAIQAFYSTFSNNVKRYSYLSTLSSDVYKSIDKLIVIYPIYGAGSDSSAKLYETYIFTPKDTSLTPTLSTIASNPSSLPGSLSDHTDRNKVVSYNEYFNVVAFEHSSSTGDGSTYDEWFTDLGALQDALNSKAGTDGYGSMQIFFSGDLSEYNQFVYNTTDVSGDLQIPVSSLNSSLDPIFIGVIKNYTPVQIYGEVDSDGKGVNIIGDGFYDVNVSHIVRK